MIQPLTPISSPVPSRRRSRRAAGGFTLIEVLAAILILSIVVPSLMEAYTVCARIASLSRQRTEALSVAQSKLEEVVATQEWINGTQSGEEKPGPTSYQWQTSLQGWEEANTQLLTITVTWLNGGQPQEVKLETVVYLPDDTGTITTTTTVTP